MRRENHRSAAAVDFIWMPGEDIKGVGVENKRKLRFFEQLKQEGLGCRLLAQAGTDGKHGLLLKESIVVEIRSGDFAAGAFRKNGRHQLRRDRGNAGKDG